MSRRIQDLSPAELAKLVSAYMLKSAPDIRKRMLPMLKDIIAEYSDEQ